MTAAITLCVILFIVAVLLSDNSGTTAYLKQNMWPIVISAIGFFLTFIGFYLMYSRVGANSYAVYAVLSIFFYGYGQFKMAS
jgi:hypothetical protein